MKKRVGLWICVFTVFTLAGCSNKALESAKATVEEYNTQAGMYNESIVPYNEAVLEISKKDAELQEALDEAQEVINKGEVPFDENTLSDLKDAMSAGREVKIEVPDELETYEEITVDEKAKKSELEHLTEEAAADTETMKDSTLPKVPSVPDYTDEIQTISDKRQAYEDSIQGLKQITAPADEFVIERLQQIDTITEIDAVTEEHDPNGMLNKQGGYIGCVYFRDSQVDWSQLYITDGEDDVVGVGCDGGGAVEIFKTAEEAEVRNTYLGAFDGTALASGSHYVYGTILVRTSNELSGTKQLALTDKIVQALVRVKD